MASAGVERLEQDSQKINNIKMANMFILNRPREKVRNDYTDLVTITKSQKLASTKISKLKIS